mmetsp:Transcript_12301/g.34211  ORF Transcript_12301/g.34211 Transcript_12301/m.34211 type:complete len:473 (+) Transcript_12301:227-1645(+)
MHSIFLDSWHAKVGGPLVDTLLEVLDLGVAREALLEVDHLLAVLGLELQANFDDLVQELPDFDKVFGAATTTRHGRHADADASWRQGARVTEDGVLVQSDVSQVGDELHLVPGETLRPQVPQNQVVLRAAGHEVVALGIQVLGEGDGVLLDVLNVGLEGGVLGLLERDAEGANLVVMWTSLEGWEDGEVNLVLVVVQGSLLALNWTLPEENDSAPRAPKTLVGGARDNVTVLEGRSGLLGRHQPADVSHVRHEERPDLVCDGPKSGVVPVPWVSAPAAKNHLWPEVQSLLLELVVVDVPGVLVHLVWQGLEVDGSRGDLLPALGVVPVGEVAAARQVKTHHPVVRVQQSRVHGEVRRTSRIWLHIHPPLLSVEVKGLEGPLLAEVLHLVDHLVSPVVPRTGKTLRVLVRQWTSQRLHHSKGSEVLARDELDTAPLPCPLLLDQGVHLGIRLLQRSPRHGKNGLHLSLILRLA